VLVFVVKLLCITCHQITSCYQLTTWYYLITECKLIRSYHLITLYNLTTWCYLHDNMISTDNMLSVCLSYNISACYLVTCYYFIFFLKTSNTSTEHFKFNYCIQIKAFRHKLSSQWSRYLCSRCWPSIHFLNLKLKTTSNLKLAMIQQYRILQSFK
jgi:hypothetical protein